MTTTDKSRRFLLRWAGIANTRTAKERAQLANLLDSLYLCSLANAVRNRKGAAGVRRFRTVVDGLEMYAEGTISYDRLKELNEEFAASGGGEGGETSPPHDGKSA